MSDRPEERDNSTFPIARDVLSTGSEERQRRGEGNLYLKHSSPSH